MKKDRLPEAFWDDNKEVWRIAIQRNGVRKYFTSSIPGRKGKHDAENKADDWLERGTQDMRLADAWDEFVEDAKKRTSRSNYEKHETTGRLRVKPVLGKRKLSSITPVLWQTVITKAADDGLSRRSLVNIRGSITAFLHYARRARWDVEQLIDGDITIPNSAPAAKKKTILQPDSIRILFSDPTLRKSGQIVTAHYIHAWRFIVATGLRRGELCGLRNEDITATTVNVKRSINCYGEETQGKNDNARRSFVLTSTQKKILADQREYLKSIGIVSPWVFPDEEGNRPVPKSIADRWRFYSAQHGFQTTIHELRHTFISLGKNDLPLELMKAVVGHSTAMDTYGIYGHSVDGESNRAATIIQGVFDNILNE